MTKYIGRFAPSPTGPLHFGSLLAAVASYLDAKANCGSWLLRMEDLDPPREPDGAADQILGQLQALGLCWDGEVLYQSSRLDAYEQILTNLYQRELCYSCDCTRGQIKAMGSVYNGQCRERTAPPASNSAIRLKTQNIELDFCDAVFGIYRQNLERDVGDFVIKRKDGLFAYQLAVVIDDAYQGVTHIVRGYDLLDSTPRQIYLQKLLGYQTPGYAHIPIVVDDEGNKLSKQQFATAIDIAKGPQLIFQCLALLGLSPPNDISGTTTSALLNWALDNWDIQRVPKLATLHL